MPSAFVSKCEEFMQNVLMKASPAGVGSDGRPTGLGLSSSSSSSWMKLSSATIQQVQEPDGSISMDYFTVLNVPSVYSVEQQLNQQVFSNLHTILSLFHHNNNNTINNNNNDNNDNESGQQQQQQEQQGQRNDTGTQIDPRFVENITLYCRRVIEQSNVKQVVGGKAGATTGTADGSAVTAFAEALRLLDLACTLDKSQVEKLIPQMKRNAALPTSQADGNTFIRYLQFFLHHSTMLLYDAEPLFKSFFDGFIASHCKKIIIKCYLFVCCVDLTLFFNYFL